MTSILVVDSHPIVADGWRFNLAPEPDLSVDAVASSLDEARSTITRSPAFDVAIIDVRLGDGSGFALLDVIDLTRTAPILVADHASSTYLEGAQRLGARGFLVKRSPMRLIVAGIRDVVLGGTAWDPAAIAHRRERPWPQLSERERHVVAALVAGLSNDEIGRDLGVASKTVERHLTRLFERSAVGSRGALLRLALEEGWLDVPSVVPPRGAGRTRSAGTAVPDQRP